MPTNIAHVATDLTRVHDLAEHLEGVAALAAAHAASFDSESWGCLAGLWHDLGKFSQAFQNRIRSVSGLDAHIESPGKVDHSTAGALFAQKLLGEAGGLPLACVIAGHHCGLGDYQDDLKPRLAEKRHLLQLALTAEVPTTITAASPPVPPSFLMPNRFTRSDDAQRAWEFWVRMLYSALVDADFLDTEAFFQGSPRTLGEVINQGHITRFDAYMADKANQVCDAGLSETKVNIARSRILQACRDRAADAQGVFSLTAPTGGGKTLAAMAFALSHALRHSLRRVIVVIPYTSIIEQNARQYRDVFGSGVVIEHHSNLDPKHETPANRIACENWDAPIIVTTNVQFLESLLANRSSRCRKLHNIARSVVIFDEVQTLPPGLLAPILDVLKELVRNYRVSLVLSTATQPALKARSAFQGFEKVTEIVPAPGEVFADLRRFHVAWPGSLKDPTSWEALAAEINRESRSVLAIVHRRDDARTLAQLVPGARHLSALMCPAHRSAVIAEIKQALKAKEIVKVISTQLVEAGVDLDFPIVYRALGGLDALAQAGGRCNREGLLDGLGELRIFVAPTQPPPGTPQKALDASRIELGLDARLDLCNPEIFDRYFRRLYSAQSYDIYRIQADRAGRKFATVASNFKLIEDDGSEPIVVPYGDAEQRLGELRAFGPDRFRLRALQPFVVTLYPQHLAKLEDAGVVEMVADTIRALKPSEAHRYDAVFGLVADGGD